MAAIEMTPSEVRERIRSDHATFRSWLAVLEQLLDKGAAGDPEFDASLRVRTEALVAALLDHIDLEDRILAPALRAIGTPWGDIRATQLVRHHRQQRVVLDGIARELADDGSPVQIATLVRGLIDELREDMVHEDQTLLNPDVLRDDVIGIDVETG